LRVSLSLFSVTVAVSVLLSHVPTPSITPLSHYDKSTPPRGVVLLHPLLFILLTLQTPLEREVEKKNCWCPPKKKCFWACDR
jgi:hypothetical protein